MNKELEQKHAKAQEETKRLLEFYTELPTDQRLMWYREVLAMEIDLAWDLAHQMKLQKGTQP